ncbi:putative hydrolase of the HAD superfamily [Sporobacter termitidis DSM 10068]|uniref:Putative hydrolase of the HAD superfamily n=1 Tax=Sporobacter termitidis DSM 10068 TaxID=1123282 RepID=A0A1M5XB00_9FIRM|nr:HAD-IA family hydrolase [Sporobacter termitidis]SHH96991.1 putative hydrolase of the HAD superfamily [Sporobacter termitidis DSM 10068]
MKYRYIWFDLGMTLVETPIETLYRQVLKAFDIHRDAAEIRRAVYLTDKEFMRRYPHILGTQPAHFMPWYLGILNYNLGVRLDLEENYRIFADAQSRMGLKWRPVPGAHELLRRLKGQGVGLGLISNWDHTCRRVLADNGLDALLDVTVVSSEVGIEKPNPEIFRMALETAGVRAEEAMYVGDNYYDDVVGAGGVGIKCLLIAPYGRLGLEEISHRATIRSIEEVRDYLE